MYKCKMKEKSKDSNKAFMVLFLPTVKYLKCYFTTEGTDSIVGKLNE